VKNLSLILNAVLGVAVIILYVLHFSQKTPEAKPPKKVTIKSDKKDSTGAEASPIVYVNTDSLIAKYEFYQKTKKDLEKKQAQAEQDLNARGQQFQNEVISLQQNYQKMSVQDAKAAEQGLAQKEQNLLQYRESISRQLLEEEQKLSKKLNENVYDYLERYCEAQGHIYVLPYSRVGGGVLFGDSTLDVTSEVIKGLNAEYQEKSTK